MALVLSLKDGIWYWSDGNPSDPTIPAALYGNLDRVFLPGVSPAPPAGDVVCPRSITFTLAGAPGATVTVVEDGGNLDFKVAELGPKADLSGLFFDFANSKLAGLAVSGDPQITQFVTGAGSVINLKNGVNLNGAKLNGANVSAFDVGLEFGLAGIGSDHQNIQTANFVLSDAAHDLSLNDLHPASETGAVGIRDLSAGQKLVAVAPYAPTATPDTATTPEDVSIVIPVSALATDKNPGATLKISEIGSGFEGPQYGAVAIASDGQSLTYTPTTLDYMVDGILTGNQDAFQVCVTDSLGGEVTSFVTVNATPVADTPTIVENIIKPKAADPATLFRFSVTVTSGDYNTITQLSDFIQSLALSLTGTNTAGIAVSDSLGLLSGNLISAPANPGLFTDEIDVSAPTGSTFNDNLSMTGTNAETEKPTVTAATTVSQTITADTETTNEDVAKTIQISSLVSAPNMVITGIGVGPEFGTVSIAPDGQSLTYTPTTLDYLVNGTLTGDQDVFQVYSSDGAGNNAVTLVTLKETPVADKPSVTLTVLAPQPGDSATETRFQLTATTGDYGTVNQGSDYLQSLVLGLTGNASGSLSDTGGFLSGDSINLPSGAGTFTDTIIVNTPNPVGNINDTLTATATAAETENSAITAAGSASQGIAIDQSTFTQQTDFTANNQSIWQTGPAFTYDWNQFLGISGNGPNGEKTFGFSVGGYTGSSVGLTTGATLSASFGLKAGFQADLHITGGNFNADLPFQISLNDIYNKTTDSLEIDPTFSVLSGGSLTTTGPGGSFNLDAVFNAMAAISGGIYVAGLGTSGSTSFSTTTTKNLVNFTSGQLHFSHSFGPINVSVAWPQVNTTGNPITPGQISSSGTSQTALGVTVDLVALALDALGIPQEIIKGDIEGIINYDLLAGNVGFGAALGQSFNLDATGLNGVLDVGTSNTAEGFSFGSPTIIDNISSLGLNPDGSIPLSLDLTPNATLQNITSIVPQFLASLTVGKISAGPLSFTLAKLSTAVNLATIPVYNNTFAANFQSQAVSTSVA
jgi:hypothetical protein